MTAPKTKMISALGIVQIFAWGSTYYLMAPLAGAIAADMGWSMAMLSAGVSAGLLISGLSAPSVGRWIGRSGGRPALSVGMICIAWGLTLLGLAQTAWVYFAAWSILGFGMAAGLYDAAFSTLGHLFGRDARSAITQLTLWGGFASTVCWPLSAWLVESYGWRTACLAYAALHVAVTLPICLRYLPSAPRSTTRAPDPKAAGPVRVSAFDLRFVCIVSAGVTLAMLATIWSIHMVTILTAQGFTLAAAIGLGALIGPAQVGARVLEMLGRGRHHPIWTMAAAAALVLAGFTGLQFGMPAAAALIAYGAGNGLWSIARGSLPLGIFGVEGYAETMGRLARPMLFAAAAAPTVGGLLIEWLGAQRTMTALAVMALVPCFAALVLAARTYRDRPRSLA